MKLKKTKELKINTNGGTTIFTYLFIKKDSGTGVFLRILRIF